MSNCGIYYIKNKINGKLYIGQSKNLLKRQQRHFNELRNNNHVNSHLQRAFNKYGENNFDFEIILRCDENDLTYFEDFFIKLYNSKNYGYNICDANDYFPDNSGKNNGMHGRHSPIRRTDLDENIEQIVEQYKNGALIKTLAEEWNTNRRVMRGKLRMVLSKEEMAEINKINQKNSEINRGFNKGLKHELPSKINMSKSRNTSGYYRVSFDKFSNRYSYSYYIGKQRKKITAKTIEKLRKRVISKNLDWIEY